MTCINRNLIVAATVTLFLVPCGLVKAQQRQSGNPRRASAVAHPTGPPTTFLFVHHAQSMTSKGDEVRLHGVAPLTLFFSDRPHRIAGHMTLEDAIELTSVGDDSFLKDPPNAVLTMYDGDEPQDVVLILNKTVVDGPDVVLKVRVLDGELPAEGKRCSLFIDTIGFSGAAPGRGIPMPAHGPFDPAAVGDPRGPLDPTVRGNPRGPLDPNSLGDPRGPLDPTALGDPRGPLESRGGR